MTFTVLYRDTGSVIGNHESRDDAVRDAVSIALERPDLSLVVGFAEVGDDGMPIAPFVSASDLLAANDLVAVAVTEAYDAAEGNVVIERPGTAGEADVVIERPEHLGEADVVTEATPRRTSMSREEIVAKVAEDSGLSTHDAGVAVDAMIESVKDALKGGEEVNFTGFGKFHVAERGTREGRNPRTGETMTIVASKVPRFTSGSGLKQSKTPDSGPRTSKSSPTQTGKSKPKK